MPTKLNTLLMNTALIARKYNLSRQTFQSVNPISFNEWDQVWGPYHLILLNVYSPRVLAILCEVGTVFEQAIQSFKSFGY